MSGSLKWKSKPNHFWNQQMKMCTLATCLCPPRPARPPPLSSSPPPRRRPSARPPRSSWAQTGTSARCKCSRWSPCRRSYWWHADLKGRPLIKIQRQYGTFSIVTNKVPWDESGHHPAQGSRHCSHDVEGGQGGQEHHQLVVGHGQDRRDEEGLVPDLRHQDHGDGGGCMCVTLSLDDNMQGFKQLTESGQKSIICLVCLSSAVRAETSEVSETVRDELMNLW